MSLVDVIILLLLGLSAWRGWRQGFMRQLFEFGGGFIGLIAGVALGPRVASAVTDQAGVGSALVSLLVVFIMLSVGQAIGFIVGHRIGSFARDSNLGNVDAGLGAGFGGVVTIVSVWLVASLLIQGPSRPIAKAISNSKLVDVVNQALPEPPDVLAYVRHYLQSSNFPQVFAGIPRPPAEPVKLPSKPEARKAAAAADQSTVRILAPACGATQLGSGWVAAESTVVTNAHVVAGGDEITVEDPAGGSHEGVVVVFDPKTDIAVVHVEGVAGPPLPLQTAIQKRGAGGATLGYPGGGGLNPGPAAVQDRYTAEGFDIYGRGSASREVYELRANIRQGDSGGPFVLSSGEVAGVVFAASTTDDDTGYALTGREVAEEIEEGSNRTEAVSTGKCTR